jgi:hypothetical protein
MEIARSKGVPAIVCLNCPGYHWARSVANMVNNLLGDRAPSNKAEGSGATQMTSGSEAQGNKNGRVESNRTQTIEG